MWRLMVLLLVLLNLGVFARGQGWLLAYGWGTTQQHEPQRVTQQIRPEALVVLTDKADAAHTAASAPEPAPALTPAEPVASSCWQSGELDEAQVDTLRPLLTAKLPPGAWVLDESRLPARWMVYMGPYNQATELAKKREQLTELKVKFFALSNTALSPGFSLGVFSTEESAKTGLQDLVKRGVRSARVIQERQASVTYHLRLPSISAADLAALDSLQAALPGKPLVLCPQPASAPEQAAASAPGAATSQP
ncbi:SPOR domain-containing protein [Rhodoferax sp. U11-2br]|uniref:SPOR domain-containing protein n=1 Tax=Rhodoferax sp. U11-2br TaxID=2838878 RepID=UPI001BE82ACC|nr:SPOR domain-containing protein [Rhodoferax sp. U11-2br]MBT3068429.1 SPOR domain-containing protein [Rhodoferax sp. U11-2br]